jgi:hypothetical protein
MTAYLAVNLNVCPAWMGSRTRAATTRLARVMQGHSRATLGHQPSGSFNVAAHG